MADEHPDLELLVRAHWREAHALLTAITRDRAAAEDLAQEVFVVAMRKRVPPGAGARLWLREVARRLAMNELRRKRPLPLAGDEVELLAAAAAPSSGSAVARADATSYGEELEALRGCVGGLGPADRELLAARYGAARPLALIAEGTGQSLGYVKQRLHRLRRRLAECVRSRLGGRPDGREGGAR